MNTMSIAQELTQESHEERKSELTFNKFVSEVLNSVAPGCEKLLIVIKVVRYGNRTELHCEEVTDIFKFALHRAYELTRLKSGEQIHDVLNELGIDVKQVIQHPMLRAPIMLLEASLKQFGKEIDEVYALIDKEVSIHETKQMCKYVYTVLTNVEIQPLDLICVQECTYGHQIVFEMKKVGNIDDLKKVIKVVIGSE